MCGNFDEQESIDQELFEQFIERTARYGVVARFADHETAAVLDTEQARAEYLDQLFKAGLTRCVNDAAKLPCGERMDALAGQAIAFARLAGFLAAQFPPEADRFRTVITAVVDAHEEQNGRR
jgi:hypothetical protein